MVGFNYGKALTMLVKEVFVGSYLILKVVFRQLAAAVAKQTLLEMSHVEITS